MEVGGLSLLFVMATTQEYQAGLKSRIHPLVTGVGPVEAAVRTTLALARLSDEKRRPDLIVSLGSAGSARHPQGSLFQIDAVAYRDMDATGFGFEPGCTPFLALPAVLSIPQRIPGIETASLSTGAAVVSGKAYEPIGQELVDMETFAVMRAGQAFHVPTIGLRGVSDGSEPVSKYEDWADYLEDVDEKLADGVDRLKAAIEGGEGSADDWRRMPPEWSADVEVEIA